ncbi:MAG: hypothetical protein ACFFDY_06455 [Candidatus Thorarchaeota archaeon]
MKSKILIFSNFFVCFLIFSGILSPVFADFTLGDSCLPIDEEGFIEYDFDKYTAPGPLRLKVNFVDLYKMYEPVEALGVNITLSELNSTTNKYEISIVDSLKYQNRVCLAYNKTLQYFIYNQCMNKLLIYGYGGYFIIPNDPVDVNIVKVFIEGYTIWFASVNNYSVTIDIANDQVILTYNEQGILIKEEVKSNDVTISTLTFISYTVNQKDDIGDLDIILLLSIITLISIASVLINKNSIKKMEYS